MKIITPWKLITEDGQVRVLPINYSVDLVKRDKDCYIIRFMWPPPNIIKMQLIARVKIKEFEKHVSHN